MKKQANEANEANQQPNKFGLRHFFIRGKIPWGYCVHDNIKHQKKQVERTFTKNNGERNC